MNEKEIAVHILALLLPTILTISEIILDKTNDIFAWVLVGVLWFAVISLEIIFYITDRFERLGNMEKEIIHIRREISLDNKIINFYQHIDNLEKKNKR